MNLSKEQLELKDKLVKELTMEYKGMYDSAILDNFYSKYIYPNGVPKLPIEKGGLFDYEGYRNATKPEQYNTFNYNASRTNNEIVNSLLELLKDKNNVDNQAEKLKAEVAKANSIPTKPRVGCSIPSNFPVKEVKLTEDEYRLPRVGSSTNDESNIYTELDSEKVLTFIAILPGLAKDTLLATFEYGVFNFYAQYTILDSDTKFEVADLKFTWNVSDELEVDISKPILTDYTNGILTINLPLKQKCISKKVEIKLN